MAKSLLALWALGQKARVRAIVLIEVGAEAKATAMLRVGVWFLASVYLVVFNQI